MLLGLGPGLRRASVTMKPFLQFANECLSAKRQAGALRRAYRIARGGIEALAQERLPVADAVKQRRRRDHSVAPPREVRPRTRPAPLAGSFYKPGPHGVQLDVTRAGKKIIFIHREGGKSSLPEITAPTLAEIHVPGIPPMGLGERCLLPLRIARQKDQMNRVRHQAISPNRDARFAAALGQQCAIGVIIAIAEEHLLPPIAPLRHMMWHPWRHNPSHSRHASCSCAQAAVVNFML